MNPKRCVIKFEAKSKRLYFSPIGICHGSEISTEDGSREETAEEESGSLGLAQCKLV